MLRTLTTVQMSTVTTAHVWMVLETSPVAVLEVTQADTVTPRLMSVPAVPASMEERVATSSMDTCVSVPLAHQVSPSS